MKQFSLRFDRRIALVVIVAIMVAFSWLAPLDSVATDRVDSSLKRVLISYASARTLNAFISIAQGTEFSLQPLGFGLNLAPGQVLDPLNDLVEQLSQVLLIASIALGIQKILLSIGASWVISLAFTTIAACWCVLHLRQRSPPSWLSKLLLILLMTRFVIPVSVVGTGIVFQNFMESSYTASQAVIASTAVDLLKTPSLTDSSAAVPDGAAAKPSLWTRFTGKSTLEPSKELGNQAAVEKSPSPVGEPVAVTQNTDEKHGFLENLNLKKKLENLKQSVENLKQFAEKSVNHMINVMAVFVLDTIVLPIFLIWVLINLVQGVLVTPRELKG